MIVLWQYNICGHRNVLTQYKRQADIRNKLEGQWQTVWDLRFSWWSVLRLQLSGMWYHAVLCIYTQLFRRKVLPVPSGRVKALLHCSQCSHIPIVQFD